MANKVITATTKAADVRKEMVRRTGREEWTSDKLFWNGYLSRRREFMAEQLISANSSDHEVVKVKGEMIIWFEHSDQWWGCRPAYSDFVDWNVGKFTQALRDNTRAVRDKSKEPG